MAFPRRFLEKMANFLFTSNRPYHRHWLRPIELLVAEHGLHGHVIMPTEYNDSPVWYKSGKFSCHDFDVKSTSLNVHFIPPRHHNVAQYGFDYAVLKNVLKEINPQYIYIREEFSQGIALQFLWHYRFKRRARVVAHIDYNHGGRASLFFIAAAFPEQDPAQATVPWPRLDGVTAATALSMACARRIGLPARVPVTVSYIPVLGPEDAVGGGLTLPWQTDNTFVVGFAGLISRQKGWRILLEAADKLPERFKVVIVGDGDERPQLEAWLQRPELAQRVYFAGYLPREELLAAYAQFDVLVLPAITTTHLVEQSPNVIAEAMACGTPVIGSSSGGIPEMVGEAGLIVPEGDPPALAAALARLAADDNLRRSLREKGLARYRQHFSCEAYSQVLACLFDFPSRPAAPS